MRLLRSCLFLLMFVGVFAVQLQAQQVKFSVTCDNRNFYQGFTDILNEINLRAGGPGQFMVSPGDIDHCETNLQILNNAFEPDIKWYPAVGNHEMPDKGTENYSGENMDYLRQYYYDHLQGTVNPGPAGCVETTYSFEVGPLHIACINEYWDGTTNVDADEAPPWGDVVPELRTWLDNDLSNTTCKWKLVVGHEPAYPQPDEDWGDARHVGDSLDANPANRDAFWNLLEQHDVVAYVCGHTHRFSHYQPPGSDVWQIDTAQARGIGQYDTFVIVNADDNEIQFDVYRSMNTSQFSLTDSWAVPEPSTLSLLVFGGMLLMKKRTKN